MMHVLLTFAPTLSLYALSVLITLVSLSASPSWAQTKPSGGIYSCIDSQGRRITSDRPIPECLDREQRELGKTGMVRRVVPPSYTAEERKRQEAQKKAEEQQRARIAEEKRRDRALLVRYPNQVVHNRERAEALARVDEVILTVSQRQKTLNEQRRHIDTELEFYQNDPKMAPPALRRRHEHNLQQQDQQQRFLQEQAREKQQINARFDEELARLQMLWSRDSPP